MQKKKVYKIVNFPQKCKGIYSRLIDMFVKNDFIAMYSVIWFHSIYVRKQEYERDQKFRTTFLWFENIIYLELTEFIPVIPACF